MAESARKFISRAPRYKLRPVDNKFFRFAKNNHGGKSFTTQFVDVSTTGMAFIIDIRHAPRINELIKVEIPLDGDQSIAWFAQVVRMESFSPAKWWLDPSLFDENIVLIAVQFRDLPPAHQKRIRETLRKKFVEVHKEKRLRNLLSFTQYASEHILKFFMYVALVAATVWILWYLAQASERYDAQKGIPWQKRFQQLNLYDGNYE